MEWDSCGDRGLDHGVHTALSEVLGSLWPRGEKQKQTPRSPIQVRSFSSLTIPWGPLDSSAHSGHRAQKLLFAHGNLCPDPHKCLDLGQQLNLSDPPPFLPRLGNANFKVLAGPQRPTRPLALSCVPILQLLGHVPDGECDAETG